MSNACKVVLNEKGLNLLPRKGYKLCFQNILIQCFMIIIYVEFYKEVFKIPIKKYEEKNVLNLDTYRFHSTHRVIEDR
jgi:hypothetical protein